MQLEEIATAPPRGPILDDWAPFGSSCVAFSHDGKLVASSVGSSPPSNGFGCVVIWDISDPRAPRDVAQLKAKACVAFTRDGELAVGGDDEHLTFYDPRTRETRQLALPRQPGRRFDEAVRRLRVAPSGRVLIGLGHDLAILEPSGALVPLPRKHQAWIAAVAWSADEQTLFTLDRHYLRVWDVANREQVRRLKLGGRYDLVVAPDGRWFATVGERLEIHPLQGRLPATPLLLRDAPARRIAMSPDGKILAMSSKESIGVVDSATGQLWREIRFDHAAEACPGMAFSPDGKLFAAVREANLTLYALT